MKLTDCKDIIDVKTTHDYDYRDRGKGLFMVFFPFSFPDSFYQDFLSESVLCADLTFPLMDVKHPSLKVYIAKYIYSIDTAIHPDNYLMFSRRIYEGKNDEFIPKKVIDEAIEKILGSNTLNAYLTTYDRYGRAIKTVTIPKPYITLDMVNDAPVLTLMSL